MNSSFGKTTVLPIWLALGMTLPVAAQTVPAEPAPAAGGEDDTIVVNINRERGKVVGDIAPEVQLDAQDIRAIGAGSIAELLQELSPQTRSGRGRGGDAPVVLINGKRVSGFAEIRNIPPEALERVDILPEEVALKYGYRADQRVINFVLRERFRAVTGEFELGGPTGGGRSSSKGEANYLRIRKGTRLSLEAEYSYDSLLTEDERNIIQPAQSRPFDLAGNITSVLSGAEIDPALSALAGKPVTVAAVPASAAITAPTLAAFVPGANAPNTTDVAPFRSLLPETRTLTLGGSYAGSLGDVAATLSGGFESTARESRLGLPAVSLALPAGNPFSPFGAATLVNRYGEGPLIRGADVWTGRVGTALNGRINSWTWTLTANYSHSETEILTDRGIDITDVQVRLAARDPGLNPYGPAALAGPLIQDRATSNTDVADADLVFNGALLALPAGDLTTTFKAGVQARSLASESRRLGVLQRADLSRTQGNMQASFDLPITSRRNDVLAGLGNLSANFNIALDELSDFGTLKTLGYGLTWRPVDALELIVSATDEEGAPSIQQLGDPQVLTPNVRVFDFVRGETVDISRLDGGNPGLVADNRKVWKVGATLKPVKDADLTLTANFIDSRIDNPIASFPTATAELEAAFPDRFTRGVDGRLLRIDNRPVNFQRSDRQELRWGLSYSEPLEPTKAEREAAAARRAAFEAQRAAGGAPAGGAGGPPGAGRPGGPGGFPGGGRSSGLGGPGGGGFRGLEGRFQLSLFHTWHLQEQILIRDGVPLLDLLDGSATGSRGGQPRHEIEARAGIGKNGLGARLGLNWQSGTRVLNDPSGATTSPDDLFFSGLTTINLRLFADLGQRRDLVRRAPWLRGARISLAVNNIADARLDVRDRSGAVPIGYQRDLIDPLGRSLTLSFRKLFF
ncbi:MAG: TonB-dependent receptor [Polymorphobacter sp.]